ncbi:flagellar biosynthetic protein FliO [uncultured Hoeflea sp.]|uniref:flagellar biosynthetic protein FliO n=1 Tax=uncultured Hoeflea sp. TaxID=538666 RepID=UPI0030EEE8CD|tara:strand:- start:35080 stop:36309 length:1230 start_codon:yes stop_codon:yes gene_type:complete
MPENLMDGQGATLLTAIIIVGIALLALVGVFWLIRNRAASTFIRGGKNRQPRLAVLDATAVDTRRRLVLIRRDDVEHLVMIGGPTDIVIESRIPQGQQVRTPRQTEPAMPASPQQQRAAQPAPQQRMPAQPAAAPAPSPAASPAERPAERTLDRPPRQAETGPRAQQPSQTHVAAAAATAGAATSIRTEAADLLETARTRVFEEPDFDESDLEDLMAVPQPPARPAPQAQAPSRPAPVSQAASAASGEGRASTETVDPIQTEAADVLETVRSRMFEEPSFDEKAFEELTADNDSRSETDSGSGDHARTDPRAPDFSRATLTASPQAAPADATPAPAVSDFEAVLEAELSEDPTLGSPRENFITAHYNEHQLADDENLLQAPEVMPEPQPSRDTLEAEMEKLLGDLSRKP